jgi:hypothetical protein
LWQFDLSDRTQLRIDTSAQTFTAARGRPGVETMALFSDAVEEVRLERWAAGSTIDLDLKGGGEFLVLEGSFNERGETFELQSWLRLPAGDRLNAMRMRCHRPRCLAKQRYAPHPARSRP